MNFSGGLKSFFSLIFFFQIGAMEPFLLLLSIPVDSEGQLPSVTAHQSKWKLHDLVLNNEE